MLSFSAPVWLWLLLLPLLLILAAAIIRSRQAVPVSSEILWRDVAGGHTAPRRRARPRMTLPLMVALAILASLAVSASAPWVGGPASGPPAIVVLLDASASMGANDAPGAPSRLDRAKEEARAILRESAGARSRTLILLGAEAAAVSSGAGGIAPFEETLDAARPSAHRASIAGPLSAASELVRSRGGGRVVIISDFAAARDLPQLPTVDGVVVEAVRIGRPAGNAAVASIAFFPFDGADGAIAAEATLANGGASPADVTVTARQDGMVTKRESLRIGAGESVSWPVTARPGPLEVLLEPGGALRADDSIHADLAAPRHAFAPGYEPPPCVAAALEALRTPHGGGAGAIWIGDALPADWPSRWISIARGARRDGRSNISPIALDLVEPVSSMFVGTGTILVDAAWLPPEPMPEGAIPVALAGGHPVAALVRAPGSRGVWWGVPLEATSLAEDGLVPHAIAGAMGWLAEEDREEERGSRLEAAADAADLAPRYPDGWLGAERPAGERRSAPKPVRPALLAAALLLLFAEGCRRVVAIRGEAAAHAPPGPAGVETGRDSLRAAAGGSR